jgi:hypothetical protein
MRSLARRRAGSIGIAMALALSITASTSAEEGSLCEALTLEDVSAIVDLPWELYFEDASACVYGAPEGHPFSHRISIQYEAGYTFDELLAEEGSSEVLIGEHPGVSLTGGALWVRVGDQTLLLYGSFTDPEVQSRVDIDGFLADVARSAVDDLPEGGGPYAQPSHEAGEGVIDAEAAGLPRLAGIEWDVEQVLQGEEFMDDLSDADRARWQAVLTMAGAEANGMSLIRADVLSALSGDAIGRYTRIVVPGADGTTLATALEEQYRATMGPDLVIEDVVVGGKDVSAWLIEDQPQAYLYYFGDTLHLFLGPEDILELIIAELP